MSEQKGPGWLRRIGPGIITAAVVLGPGSILAASRIGASFGYSLIWLLICAVLFMAVFTAISARLGCALDKSLLETVAIRYGRWLAVLIGISAWLVVTGFQFGNNMGVLAAMEGLVPAPPWIWPPLFTFVSIAFLFSAKRVYRALERLMIVLVGVMILTFVGNLVYVGVNVAEVARGLVPRLPQGKFGDAAMAALVATTFSIVAAFYQAYLVQERRWGLKEYRAGIRDAWLGIGILGVMTLTIMLSAAGAFAGRNVELGNAGDVAAQLEYFLGVGARYVFCLGLVAASFSSFIINTLLGGGLLADGLGIGRGFDNPRVKAAASASLLVGMTVALAVVALNSDASRVGSIIIAQAMTLLAAPLSGIVLLVLANSRLVMGKHRNRLAVNLVAGLGLLVVLWMTWATGRSLVARLFG